MMERFTEYHAGVPVILDKGEGESIEECKECALYYGNRFGKEE